MTKCPECGSTDLSEDSRGETVCRNCGLVVEADQLDRGPEWRAYTAAEHRKRARAEGHVDRLATGEGLGSLVGREPGFERLRRTARTVAGGTGSDKRFQQARKDLRSLGHRLQCPDVVVQQAEELLAEAREEGLTQGRSYRALGAACLLAVCRQRHLGRSEDELAQASGESLGRVRGAYQAITRELDIRPPALQPSEVVNRVVSKADLDHRIAPRIATRAQRMLQRHEDEGDTVGTHPVGWAAAAVYLAAKDLGASMSLRRMAGVAEVSVPTIRARISDLARPAS